MIAGGHRLEATWIAPRSGRVLVFLHEGLGCASQWRSFPAEVAEATGLGALVYSRWGYGGSDPVTPPRPLRYMHDEAETLAEILAPLDEAVLVGHSDGGSIALLAGGHPRVRGLVLLAPHVFCEDISVESITAAAAAYQEGDLRERLARYHGDNVDGAFWGWNLAWLDPAFRAWNITDCLPAIIAPVLLVQGAEDPYGTLAQLDAIERGVRGPVQRLVLPGCEHAPQRDARSAPVIADFVRGLPP